MAHSGTFQLIYNVNVRGCSTNIKKRVSTHTSHVLPLHFFLTRLYQNTASGATFRDN